MPSARSRTSPSSSDGVNQNPGSGLGLRGAVAVAISAVVYVGIYTTGVRYETLYRALNLDLPWLTRIVMSTYKFNGLLLLMGLVPCAILLSKPELSAKAQNTLLRFVMFGFALALVSLVVVLVATYIPVPFAMGSASQ